MTQRCQELLGRRHNGRPVLLTTSCTHALELTALLLGVGAGDEVIVPSFTFVSTANAFALRGARPVFVDIRPDTLNLDEAQLEDLVTPRTRAIVAVHYGGVACEMDAVCRIAERHGLAVIEDNAHGLFGRYFGRDLGTFGCLATLSFHHTKNVTCGEGGALVVNDVALVERAEMIRDKGTDRARFYRGEVERYSWQVLGSSFVLSDVLAAVLLAQLEGGATIQAKRHAIWTRYRDGLTDWANGQGVQLPVVPLHCEHPAHLFHLVLPSAGDRARVIDHLASRDIEATWHYTALHSSAMGRRVGSTPLGCPVAEAVASRLVRLPFYTNLSEGDQDRVIEAVTEFSSSA
jgi:dTDP-4-amino-4,6-dideoxygalactose transaminase